MNNFTEKISPEPTSGCWLWTAGESHGYGVIGDGHGGAEFAHRASWRIFRGDIPSGMNVCHHCDVPFCVNPDHLFIGTQKDNVRDMANKGRHGQQRKTHCKRGHELSGDNVYRYEKKPNIRHCKACRGIHDRQRDCRERGKA